MSGQEPGDDDGEPMTAKDVLSFIAVDCLWSFLKGCLVALMVAIIVFTIARLIFLS